MLGGFGVAADAAEQAQRAVAAQIGAGDHCPGARSRDRPRGGRLLGLERARPGEPVHQLAVPGQPVAARGEGEQLDGDDGDDQLAHERSLARPGEQLVSGGCQCLPNRQTVQQAVGRTILFASCFVRVCSVSLKRILLTVGVTLAAAQPAFACQYEFAPEPVGGPSARFIGKKMGAAATFVDVVMAEGASDVRQPDGKPAVSKALSFRVLDRWKGNSPDRFILFGWIPPKVSDIPAWSITHWVDDQGRVEPFESVRESTVAMPAGMTSCDPSALAVTPGRIYIVYREADGRLLGAVTYHDGNSPRRGTSIVEAGLWPENDWARELHIGAAYEGRKRPQPQTIDPARTIVRFRRPITAARATELLRRAGARPYAVTMVRGGVRSEYRLDAGQAWLGIVADAADWAKAQQTDQTLIKAQARALIDKYAVRDVSNDAAKHQVARKLIEVGTARVEKGPALVESVAVVGGEAVRRVLAALPEVAEIVAAARIRGRVVSGQVPVEAVPSGAWQQDEGLPLYRRLAKFAGRDLPPTAIEGGWKLFGTSYENYAPDDVMTLTFKDGRVRLASPCIPATTGTYRFDGTVLEIEMEKQSVKSCPQRSSYWLAEYWFGDNKVLTVRRKGDALTLIGTGGEYIFHRVPSGREDHH